MENIADFISLNTGDTTASIDSLFELVYWVSYRFFRASYVDSIYLDPYILETVVVFNDFTHNAEIEITETSSNGPF